MKLLEFLKILVPKDGRIVIGWKGNRFHNKSFSSHESALTFIKQKAKTQVDIYFALASFKQDWHKNAKGKNVLRVRDNVKSFAGLWFDIDFKDGLSDPTQVVAALREFSKRTGVPSPSILVHSGNGIHCYWPLTTAVPHAQWQRMADKLKELAREANLPVDLVCTADACRVLRPPGTKNWKDPSNPRPVRFLHATDKLHCPDALEVALESSLSTQGNGAVIDGLGNTPSYLQATGSGSTDAEFTGMHSGSASPVESFFGTIIEKCGVARHWNDTRGADCSEPEWTAALQVLKHCKDADMYVHEISKGHIDYDPTTTTEKFQQRLENDAGPTLCSTLVGYREDICKACPHFNKIKTPLALGAEVSLVTPVGVTLSTFRAVPGGNGMERKMLNPETNQYEWVKVLRRKFDEVATSKSVVTRQFELNFKVFLEGAETIEITLPAGYLGNDHKLKETMAAFGAPLMTHEMQPFKALMSTWLEQLQSARAVAAVTEQLGWVRDENKKIDGFSAGTTTFLGDGTQKDGVRIRSEFSPIGRMYEPSGDIEVWKRVAKFLTDQNNPAFTTVLASAFAAPLLTFTGIPGGILSIVSPESGVGKSSALKTAQAVWGSPTQGMNAVDDTKLSVARKLGFLNTLPAYWDELRGKETMEGFTTLAFQIAQGKEKTRLRSDASMSEVNTWETMLIAASNESIFEYMGQSSQGSDAGVARTYEIVVAPFDTDKSRAELSILFEELNQNYGTAGQVYSKYLAENHEAIRTDINATYVKLSEHGKMKAAERIWFAIITTLIVGAKLANRVGLTEINLKDMSSYLINNITQLRARGKASMTGTTPEELIAAYMQQHQDKGLIVESFAKQGDMNFDPQIISPPRADRILYQLSKSTMEVRVSKTDFVTWLKKSKNITWASVAPRFKGDCRAYVLKTNLGSRTKWELPRQLCIEMSLHL